MYSTCAIITRAAAPSVADAHDRMLVVLRDTAFDTWLDPASKSNERYLYLSQRGRNPKLPTQTKKQAIANIPNPIRTPMTSNFLIES